MRVDGEAEVDGGVAEREREAAALRTVESAAESAAAGEALADAFISASLTRSVRNSSSLCLASDARISRRRRTAASASSTLR